MQTIRNIDYVILLCTNIEESTAFYRDVLGFQVAQDSTDRWRSFQVGSQMLTLRPRGDWFSWNDGEKIPGSANVQLAFRVPPADVDKYHERLLENDITILREPENHDFGHRTLFFRDPECNIIEIYAEI